MTICQPISILSRLLLVGLLLLGTQLGTAAELNWQPRLLTDDGIATYTAKVKGQSSKAFRGVMTLPYSVEQISTLLLDKPRVAEWLYHCKHVNARAVAGRDSVLYLQFSRMGPVSPRDVLLDSQFALDAQTGVFRLTLWNITHADWPKQKKHVRMKKMHNEWMLTPLPNGHTEVDFNTVIHLGGWLPNWATNMVAADGPWRILRGLRRQLQRGLYGQPVAAK